MYSSSNWKNRENAVCYAAARCCRCQLPIAKMVWSGSFSIWHHRHQRQKRDNVLYIHIIHISLIYAFQIVAAAVLNKWRVKMKRWRLLIETTKRTLADDDMHMHGDDDVLLFFPFAFEANIRMQKRTFRDGVCFFCCCCMDHAISWHSIHVWPS